MRCRLAQPQPEAKARPCRSSCSRSSRCAARGPVLQLVEARSVSTACSAATVDLVRRAHQQDYAVSPKAKPRLKTWLLVTAIHVLSARADVHNHTSHLGALGILEQSRHDRPILCDLNEFAPRVSLLHQAVESPNGRSHAPAPGVARSSSSPTGSEPQRDALVANAVARPVARQGEAVVRRRDRGSRTPALCERALRMWAMRRRAFGIRRFPLSCKNRTG